MSKLMNNPSLRAFLFCGVLAMGPAWLGALSADGAQLEATDGTLKLNVHITGTTGGSDGKTALLGQQLKYVLEVRNVSQNAVCIPEPARCVDVALTRDSQNMLASHDSGPARKVSELMPNQMIEFSGEVTLLDTNICQLRISFYNTCSQQVEVKLMPHGNVGNATAMILKPVSVPIKNVWVGHLSVSTNLDASSYLAGDLRTRYTMAMQKALDFEQTGVSMTEFRPAAHGRIDINHDNVTQQSEVLDVIRQIGSDGNTSAVTWLWECFSKSRKNSPAHVACMAELHRLLARGLGSEHALKFFAVAKADETQEAIVTRLYAMDAAALYCTRSEFFCNTKGNRFLSPVAADMQKEARSTLNALTRDRLKDIHTRAKQLLGMDTSESGHGKRKYVAPVDEGWLPGPEDTH